MILRHELIQRIGHTSSFGGHSFPYQKPPSEHPIGHHKIGRSQSDPEAPPSQADIEGMGAGDRTTASLSHGTPDSLSILPG